MTITVEHPAGRTTAPACCDGVDWAAVLLVDALPACVTPWTMRAWLQVPAASAGFYRDLCREAKAKLF